MDLKYQTPRGIHDNLPEQFAYIDHVVGHATRLLQLGGFQRIETPVFEETALFQRSIGDSTDIVSKEMYTFEDRDGVSMSLRPEGTAGAVRAFLQHGMASLPQPVMLWYYESMYRYDRPQKGRYRQHSQIGVEVIGESDPSIDAQLIALTWTLLTELGIADRFTVHINSLGTPESRKEFLKEFTSFIEGKERALSEEDRSRLTTNPLRLLDSKHEDTQEIVAMAPKLADFLDADSRTFHETLLAMLDELDIPYRPSPTLVRGQDYYTKTVFEVSANDDPAFAVGGGGRYDGLVELIGGPSTPAVGFGLGIERLVLAMKAAGIEPTPSMTPLVFVAPLGDEAKVKSLPLLQELRRAGIPAVGALGKGSIKAQLSLADKAKVRYALILGQLEVIEGKIIVRDMAAGKQWTVPFGSALGEVQKLLTTG